MSEKLLPAKIQPADHISMEVEYNFAPNKTSGGRYHFSYKNTLSIKHLSINKRKSVITRVTTSAE